jgi:hypothetical protein
VRSGKVKKVNRPEVKQGTERLTWPLRGVSIAWFGRYGRERPKAMFSSAKRRLASIKVAGRPDVDDGAAVNAPTVTPSRTKLRPEKAFIV